MPGRAEGMGGIGHDDDAADGPLQLVGRAEKMLLALDNGENTVIVAGYAAEVNRDDDLGLFGDGGLQRIIVHFERVAGGIDQPQLGADVADDRSRRGIRIGAGDALVAGADAQQAQRHFGTGRLRIEADAAGRAEQTGALLLQLLDARAGGDPARSERLCDLVDLGIGYVGR